MTRSLLATIITLATFQTAASAQAPAVWHAADSSGAGLARFTTELSSTHRVRVILTDGSQRLASTDMDPTSLGRWTESVRVGLALGARRPFEFENTVALQPALKGADTAGFAITLADSVGDARTVFATVPEAAAFLTTLEHGVERLHAASDQDLATIGAVRRDSTEERCERVRDSIFVQVTPANWPIAKWPGQPGEYHPPRAPGDTKPGVPVVAAAVILADGSMDSSYFDVAGTRDVSYKRRALELLSSIKWSPGLIAGCPVVSKASLITVRIGIPRAR